MSQTGLEDTNSSSWLWCGCSFGTWITLQHECDLCVVTGHFGCTVHCVFHAKMLVALHWGYYCWVHVVVFQCWCVFLFWVFEKRLWRGISPNFLSVHFSNKLIWCMLQYIMNLWNHSTTPPLTFHSPYIQKWNKDFHMISFIRILVHSQEAGATHIGVFTPSKLRNCFNTIICFHKASLNMWYVDFLIISSLHPFLFTGGSWSKEQIRHKW